MRSKDPELMDRIKNYAEQFYLINNVSPSTSKIAAEMGIVRGTVYKYLVAMSEKGMIEYDGEHIMTKAMNKMRQLNNHVPIVGSIPCGSPQIEEENIEEYVTLPVAIFGKGDYFILRAEGTSMVEAGIDDGDLVVIKKQATANDGDIVVALVENQNTLKRLYHDAQNQRIILHPENKTMQDIVVNECYIQGVACHVIKTL